MSEKSLITWASLVATVGLVVFLLSYIRDQSEQMPTAHPLEAVGIHEPPRSPHWPKVRAEYLSGHPICEACGSKEDLQVHHCLPFHHDPVKELDLNNLITLCGPKGHSCHLRLGHCFNYKTYNPNVRADAALQLKRIKERLVNWRQSRGLPLLLPV